jgi:hypothetical protein
VLEVTKYNSAAKKAATEALKAQIRKEFELFRRTQPSDALAVMRYPLSQKTPSVLYWVDYHKKQQWMNAPDLNVWFRVEMLPDPHRRGGGDALQREEEEENSGPAAGGGRSFTAKQRAVMATMGFGPSSNASSSSMMMMGAQVEQQEAEDDEEDEDEDEDEDEEGGSSSSSLLLIGKKKKRTTSSSSGTAAPKRRMNNSERVRSEEAASAAKILYPIRYISPGWTVAEEKERGKLGGSGLEPTFDEVEAANLGGKRTWSDVVNSFLNPSEIGHKKGQWDPNIRPINLLLGGIITVRLRKYKTSHPDKGIIRVFADPRLGFDPIHAHMEMGAAAWRREVHRREREEIGALGFVDARATFEDRHSIAASWRRDWRRAMPFLKAMIEPPPMCVTTTTADTLLLLLLLLLHHNMI